MTIFPKRDKGRLCGRDGLQEAKSVDIFGIKNHLKIGVSIARGIRLMVLMEFDLKVNSQKGCHKVIGIWPIYFPYNISSNKEVSGERFWENFGNVWRGTHFYK